MIVGSKITSETTYEGLALLIRLDVDQGWCSGVVELGLRDATLVVPSSFFCSTYQFRNIRLSNLQYDFSSINVGLCAWKWRNTKRVVCPCNL